MTSTSMRRLPLRSVEQQQDENAYPASTASCAGQIALGASSSTSAPAAASVGRMRSPSKLPTLSDIAARLNRDREATPSSSPSKQTPGVATASGEANAGEGGARRRLELTGRITGSPKPPAQVHGDRKSLVAAASPSKLGSADDEKTLQSASPKAPSSGACSPTKRMLAKGLPSLEEIRDRMSRKGVAGSDESPKMPSAPSSPAKLEDKAKSPEPLPSVTASKPVIVEQKPPSVQIASTKPAALRVSTAPPTVTSGTRLNHPLPAPPKSPSYPLQHEWTLYFDSRSTTPQTPSTPSTPLATSTYEANLRTIGTFSHVPTFLACFSTLHRPSQLERHTSYHVFKDGIKPMWEDARNSGGGKWTITFRQRNAALVDRSWLWLVLGLIGEELDAADEVCGAVCSVRPRGDRVAVWTRAGVGREAVERVGRRLVRLLELGAEPGVVVEWSAHEGGGGEGMWGVNNPVAVARTPTMGSFAPDMLSPGSVKAASTSPQNSARSASPNPTAPTEAYSRLAGQHASTSTMFARPSPTAAQPAIGALGQSLGLGIANVSPGTSPNPNDARKLGAKKSFSSQPAGEMAFSWRRGSASGSASPQRRDGAGSRSSSPFKP
ncbi:related to CDC33-translation initiation factor eIF4E [Sporisorium reilianum SRZ2]|uniref:Related to CDC33-translation initiation factor eIF4E n=1 Tax=Sporisorium reilianum (strain SRZ2) TaxID=999809 RepID=E7A1W2_SPORE|nr:related to CDC33-translation initiation factor eIF4E [Sporisorium reilianum SRZ2]